MTKNVDAIRKLFAALNSRVGNLRSMPGVFPDYPAPIVRNAADGREIAMARWGMPSSQRALIDATKKRAHKLEAKGKTALLDIARAVANLAKVSSTRQSDPLGLGHAVLQAKALVGNEPFAVILPDDIVDAKVPCMKQMVEAFNETQSSILGSEVVEGAAISAYGCLDCTPDPKNPRLLAVKNMVEKPKPQDAPSTLALIGRYVLMPEVFEYLDKKETGAGGEIQLTDAMAKMIGISPFHALRYDGQRYDCGHRLGFLEANVAVSLHRADTGAETREMLNRLLKV